MSQHRADDDDDRDDDDDADHASSVTDVVVRWRYTLSPTLYTDEDSDTSDLLWQLVLETRAARHWAALKWWTLLCGLLALAAIVIAVN